MPQFAELVNRANCLNECLACGIHFESFRHFSDPHPKECPQDHRSVRRVFSPPAIVFNGPRFYVTDNRNDGGGSRKLTHTDKEKTLEKKEAAD